MSHWLAGLDEAGYGPRLGPMVIGFVALESEKRIAADSPWELLSPLVGTAGRRDKNVISIADSKRLHRSGTGDLSRLEEGVLAFIGCERGSVPRTFRQLIDHCTADRSSYLDEYPWYRDQDLELPYSCSGVNLAGKIRRLERSFERCAISSAEVRAIPLEVREFNSQVKRLGTKGAVDAWAMGRFLQWLWRQSDRKQIEVWSDRLGGRERYGPLLYPLFPDCSFKILEQDKDRQSYRATTDQNNRVVTVHFRKECEQFSFCTALASMTAKYLRELHMVLLNRYWSEHVPDIKPTAGYPQDAGRFIGEVEGARRHLRIDTGLLVRSR
ncbi:MAG: hypothetical protein VX764_00830 [Planctomycetota bacterium]|nr:hypothetical protein [Planctomycetota bacterium]